MSFPVPTPIYRLVHVDNLSILIARRALHAPNTTPQDGSRYRPIHDTEVQASRRIKQVPCDPGGSVHDYVPFYFGPLSVMLLKLKSGGVSGYDEGQQPLVYLTATVQDAIQADCRFVFTDGHGLATFTRWFDAPADLSQVDWNVVKMRYWADRPEDNDRKRRKQAEFLIWKQWSWGLISGIGVLNEAAKIHVEGIMDGFPGCHRPKVDVQPNWYYH